MTADARDRAATDVTVLWERNPPVEVEGRPDGGRLWLAPDQLSSATGWTLRREGLCRADACVPLPPDGAWRDAEDRLDVTALAAHLRQPAVCDEEHGLWAFGPVASTGAMAEAEAPDVELPDVDGRRHRLSDHRGQKVLLLAWGSYCGCRYDLPLWQRVYEELRPRGFVIVAVALDSAGAKAAAPWIRPTQEDLDAYPARMARVMGWEEHEWRGKAAPTFPCLIDEEHVIVDLYDVRNVPTAVWIDERGRIVRPAEAPGFTDHFRNWDATRDDLPEEDFAALVSNRRVYTDALRDWVARGDASAHALSPEEVCARTSGPTEQELRAAMHVRIGRLLYARGRWQAAQRHLERASALRPENWCYFRQIHVLDPELVGELNRTPENTQRRAALGARHYYDPIDMPGVVSTPKWLKDLG